MQGEGSHPRVMGLGLGDAVWGGCGLVWGPGISGREIQHRGNEIVKIWGKTKELGQNGWVRE